MPSRPQLEMLWEAVDPNAALRIRFRFADASAAASWLGDTLRHAWGLGLQRCDRLVISASKLLAWVTIDGRGFIAKCAIDPARFARLAEVDALITWLDGEGIPVAAPLRTTDGSMRVDRDGYSMGLYPPRGRGTA